jgi:hypothetical protein
LRTSPLNVSDDSNPNNFEGSGGFDGSGGEDLEASFDSDSGIKLPNSDILIVGGNIEEEKRDPSEIL